ncbi:hypothetical protein [Tenacibaculum aquimarinum]|uniref:hypothetical protein n=1 Tax=Tenacibaculum aquimarinum TaxID=2910675 RepID=UPI001F0B30CD|nr:hypothetical protein [Tenacibaculum aquimarinum]MCH3884164.1 hypothetical protein [Tenacibaculum aquimarinum]
MKEIKLSSKLTIIGLYGGALLYLIMIPVIFKAIESESFHIGMLFAGAITLAMAGFLVYQFKFVCSAKIVNNKLILKKQFHSPETYTFDKIGDISSFRLKNTKYTTVKMKGRHQDFEKYMIITSKSFLFKDKIDAEEKLKELKRIDN